MNPHLNRGANLFLLCLGMLSLCALVRDSFELILPDETFLWLALLCFLLWLSTAFRYGILAGLPLSALTLWYLYRNISVDLLAEAGDLLDHIGSVYYGHYSSSSGAFAVTDFSGNHEVAVLFLFFILAAFVAAALNSGSFRISLVLLATLPLFALCIAVNGEPGIYPVIGFLTFLAGLHLGGDVFRTDDGAGKAMLLGLLPCALVLCALLLLYRPDTYTPTEYDISLSQRFDKLGNALAGWMSEDGDLQHAISETFMQTSASSYHAPSGWNQGSDDLDLTAPFDSSRLDDEAFRITADSLGSLYFRGRSYGEYLGTSWTSAVENSRGNALSFAGYAVASLPDAVESQFQLRSPVSYDILYLPYFSISDAENDVVIPANGYSTYGGAYYFSSELTDFRTLPSQWQTQELQYREYVHSYYTRLPDSTRNELLSFCRAHNLSSDQGDVLSAVADLVRSQGVYDVNIAPYPSNDYAVWFLTESHTGYCIHFATAAVALYRTLGIPSRVCEGYLVNNLYPGNTVLVTGGDAHAWAEVYVDGFGWIPVEVTASAADDPDQHFDGSVFPSVEPVHSEQSELIDEDNTEPEQAEDGNSASALDSELQSDAYGTSDTDSSFFFKALRILVRVLFILLSVLAAFAGRYKLIRKMLNRRLSSEDNNRKAVYCYRQAERVLRYGGEMPADLLQIAEKAHFSSHIITPEESARCFEQLGLLTEEVYQNLSRWKKLVFRYISANQ